MPSEALRIMYASAGRCVNCGRTRDRNGTICTRCATAMRLSYIKRTGAVHLAPQASVLGLDAPVELCCGWWTTGPTVLPWVCLTCGAVRRRHR